MPLSFRLTPGRDGLRRGVSALALLLPLAAAAAGGSVAVSAAPSGAPATGTPAAGAGPRIGLPQRVEDPHFGDGLFQLYQDKPFGALTSLMVSQHFGRVPRHADETELVRGGLLLGYGLDREAGAIFEHLLARGATPALRDRAWFQLAQLRYQRAQYAAAREAIEQIAAPLPGALQEDRGLLEAQILMALGENRSAASRLEALLTETPAARYARYNLGVALIRDGDGERGTAVLDALGGAPAENEEFRQLRDRANVALGYAALREQRAADARRYLERVRLHSPQSARALLGFGWASLALKSPEEALVPWTELLGRDPGEAAVLEARLAVPHAQLELGAPAQALAGYEAALEAYEAEDRRLDESIAAIRQGRLVQELAERNPGQELSWADSIESLPELPHAGHLNAVLAQHGFQVAFRHYRDLRFLSRNLTQWQETLGLYREMLEHRRAGYEQRLPAVIGRSRELGVAPLAVRRDALATELQQAERAADGAAFADARQWALQERLARVRQALTTHAGDPGFERLRERARLAAGALDWELSQSLPERAWQARRGLQAIDRELEQARRHETALQEARRDEPVRFAAYAARLDALEPQLAEMLPRVAALQAAQQQALQEQAVAALEAQKSRLEGYSTQARLAVARLLDHATLSRSSDDATTR